MQKPALVSDNSQIVLNAACGCHLADALLSRLFGRPAVDGATEQYVVFGHLHADVLVLQAVDGCLHHFDKVMIGIDAKICAT